MNNSKNSLCIPDGWQLTDKPQDCWREDVKFWNTIKKRWEPRKKNHRGVPFSPHMVYIVPIPDIPEGYRLAKPEEHTRKDVKLWLTTSNEWILRIPSYEGTRFDEKELYIVPIDLPTYSSPGKEKTPMQHKLTECQIELLNSAFIQLRDFGLSFGYENTSEGSDYWHKVLNNIYDKRLNGTSDGKPYIEPEPPIPEGYRKANPDEWKRTDVKCWWPPLEDWRLRTNQGTPFDNPIMRTHYIVPCRPPVPEGWRVASEDEYHRSDIKTWEGSHDGDRGHWRVRPGHKAGKPFNGPNYLYIVPIDPPLTDQDACVWPRLLIMVRDEYRHPWIGPYKYLGKTDASYSIDPDNGGCATDWKQARRATTEEIKEKLQK